MPEHYLENGCGWCRSCTYDLGSAPTTRFYGRVGSLSQKVRKFLVVSGRVWSCFGRVFGRFLVAFENEI